MPFALTDVDLFCGGLELSCFASSLTMSLSGAEVDATTFCSGGWMVPITGMRESTWTVSGPTDMATATAAQTSAVDEILAVNLGTTYTTSVIPIGAVEGNAAYFTESVLMSRTPLSGPVGELATHELTLRGSNPTVRGVLASHTTVTANGNGTGHNLGAVSSTQRVWAALHVLTAGGTSTPTLTVKIQSDDNSGFTSATDRITFTAATAKGGQYSSAVGAITDTYWRANFAVSGTNPSFQVRVLIGIL